MKLKTKINEIKQPNDKKGISPVIGVVLLIAIVVAIAGVLGFFVLNLNENENISQSGVQINETADNLVVKVIETGNTDVIEVRIEGSHVSTLANAGDSTTISSPAGSTITVVGVNDGDSTVIRSYETEKDTGDSVTVTSPGSTQKTSGTVEVNPKIENATVQSMTSTGDVFRTTTTDSSGNYSIDAAPQGYVTVIVKDFDDSALSNSLYAGARRPVNGADTLDFNFTNTQTATVNGETVTVSYTTTQQSSTSKQIATVAQLQAISTDLSSSYTLVTDVDASATSSWNSGSGFEPVGTSSAKFQGSFDGNSYTVSNLNISRSSSTHQAVFSYTSSSADIKNIVLDNASISGSNYSGILIGDSDSSISNVSVLNSSVESSGYNTGIVVGSLRFATEGVSDITVSDSSVTSSGGSPGRIGGIGGRIDAPISNVSIDSVIIDTSGNEAIGGVAGKTFSDTSISNVSISGLEINSGNSDQVGGVVGNFDAVDISQVSVESSSITGSDDVGGLVGDHSTSASAEGILISDVTLSNGVSVTGNHNVGGVAGHHEDVTAQQISLDNSTTVVGGKEVGGVFGQGYEPSDDETIHISDVTSEATMILDLSRDSYPGEIGGIVGDGEGKIENVKFTGSIETKNVGSDGVEEVGGIAGKHTGSIHYSKSTETISGSGYESSVGGLVGRWDGSASDIIYDSQHSGDVTSEKYAGGLVGRSDVDGTISYSYSSGDITGKRFVGGLVGRVSTATSIENSYATGSISSSEKQAGGLVGGMTDGYSSKSPSIEQSYFEGSVSGGTIEIGGLVGYMDEGSISDSYALSSVSGTSEVGGLGGDVDISVSNSYAGGGTVSGSSDVGGLIGLGSSTSTDSYWDTEATGQSSSTIGIGLTTSEMQGTNSDSNMGGFDFSNVWSTSETYPTLRSTDNMKVPVLISAGPTPSSVVAGEDITVSFEATSPPSEDRTAQFNLLIDGTQQKSITKTIPAGETVTKSFTYTTSSSGANAEATISTSEVTSSPITIRKYEKIIQGSSKSNLSEDVPINLKLSYGTQLTESLTDKDPDSSRFGATYDPNYSNKYDAYTFDGNSGDTVTITMTKQYYSTSLILLDSSGSQVAANTNAANTSDLTDSEDSRIKDYTLQQNGEYIIIATTEYGWYINDYSLELQKN